jgi:2-polyprenyl-3-methyl-5-hydroxy-6-metoxy-1,4-benzoquinol methylase
VTSEVTEQFVLAHLPAPPCRLLEVGCGSGELALELAAAGYDVVAIDPRSPNGEIFRRVALEAFVDPNPFDAAVANRSLHHIPNLAGAIAQAPFDVGGRTRSLVGSVRPGAYAYRADNKRRRVRP